MKGQAHPERVKVIFFLSLPRRPDSFSIIGMLFSSWFEMKTLVVQGNGRPSFRL
jgi:hypothetical protein